MRKLLYLLFLLPILATGKDPCSSIKRSEDKMRGYISYTTPNAPVVVNKWMKDFDTTLSISFIIQSPASEVTITKGLYVEFEDCTYYRLEDVVIDKMDIAGKQVYGYRLVLNSSNISLFRKRIKQFGLGGLTGKANDVTDKIPEFLECLTSLK